MTKASDNAYPSVLATEGTVPTSPAAGKQRLYIDSADHKLKRVNSSGTVTVIESAGSGNVATDTIWDAAGDLAVGTGADTAARLAKGNAGGVLAMGNSAVIWNAGTSFPASKATNDRYWRTDLGMEFYWDGTRWVSSTLYTASGVAGLATPLTANGDFGRIGLWEPTYDVYLVDLRGATYVLTTNDGTKYWTIALKKNSDDTTIASFATNGDTAGTWTNHLASIAAASTEKGVYLSATKTSTPGNLYPAIHITYRIIAT